MIWFISYDDHDIEAIVKPLQMMNFVGSEVRFIQDSEDINMSYNDCITLVPYLEWIMGRELILNFATMSLLYIFLSFIDINIVMSTASRCP